MSTTTAEMSGATAAEPSGPLEQQHLQHANYRAVANSDGTITKTHWHIGSANFLGWGFDGMDGVIFALVTPLIIKDFGLTIPEWRSGIQIWLLIGIFGLYFWPWLADKYGRRTLLALNIALFSLLMPVVALSPTFAVFIAARAAVGFALNGEWSLGSMLSLRPGHRNTAVVSSASTAPPGASAPRWPAPSPASSPPNGAGVSPSWCPA